MPPPPPPSYSTAERETLFETIQRLISGGLSLRRACESTGTPPATFKLWQGKAHATGGSLADDRRHRSGRTAAISLSEAESIAFQKLVLLKEGSFATAVEFFQNDPACASATRAFIAERLRAARAAGTAPVWPVSLRRAAQLAFGTMAAWQGPKAAQSAQPKGRYSRTITLPNGQTIPLVPGFAWTFDDYSANEPYILGYADGKERLCRQVLCGMDIATRGWLGAYHVGKERDAYTAADVLETFRLVMEGQGHVPRVFILEQGRWKGTAVTGIALDEDGRTWGSVEEAGIILHYVFKSQGKTEIEDGFDLLQGWTAGEAAGIGRFRGIMERETSNLLAVNAGRRDARACGFLTLTESAALHETMFRALNNRPKHFRELARHIAPDDLLAAEPYTPRPLDPAHRWLFYPVKDEATVRDNGFVIKTVAGREYVFHVNGVADHVHLPNGYRVLIAFDPSRPELGAHIANRETGSINRAGFRLGQTLLTAAPPLQASPRLSLRSLAAETADDVNASWKTRQGAIRAAETAFRAIVPDGKRGLRTQRKQNRAGDLVEIIIPGESENGQATAPATTNPRFPRPRKQRPEAESPIPTRGARQTGLKTQANAIPETADDEDLEAAEAAFLAGL